jgi:hypothetical protein
MSFLEIALLRWRERMIEQHHVGIVFDRGGADFIGLATADEEARIGAIAAAANADDRQRARRARERLELEDIFRVCRCADAKAHEHGPLTCAWSLEQFGFSRKRKRVRPRGKSFSGDRLDRRSVFVGDAHVARRDNRRNRVLVNHLAHAVLE